MTSTFHEEEDLDVTGTSDEAEKNELARMPRKKLTREGYLKDGFVVDETVENRTTVENGASAKKMRTNSKTFMQVQYILTYHGNYFEQELFEWVIPHFTNDTDFVGHLFSSMPVEYIEKLQVISTCVDTQHSEYPEFLKNRGGKYVFLPTTKENRFKAKWLRRRDRRLAARKIARQQKEERQQSKERG